MDITSLTPDKQVKFQYWLNVIHECRASGLTNREWCDQNGISLKSYYYWIAKFRKLALEELPRKEYGSSIPTLSGEKISVPSAPEPSVPAFIEIPTSSPKTEQPIMTAPAAILKAGSISVELYANASESFLQALFKAVQKC